jgi:hypothetical protein
MISSAVSFTQRHAAIDDFLPAPAFAGLRAEIEGLTETERSYVPAHKKGGTIAYDRLRATAPAAVALYHSADLQDLISRIVGAQVFATPEHDQSSLSVLRYEKPGDHIGWHYDHNFYRGRHFTVLVGIENRASAGGLSSARLVIRCGKQEKIFPTAPNTLVVFEGARTLHKVTPIAADERRVILSMTYCTDPTNSFAFEVSRRIKDMAFIGPRALWT